MKRFNLLLTTATCGLLLLATGAWAQRARTVGEPQKTDTKPQSMPTPPPAPPTVKAKYEGGVFGYNKRQTGTLTFDDANNRLVFRDKQGHEYISIPYPSIAAVYGDTQSRRPTAAGVLGSASIYTLPALLIRKKYRYLTMQFNDPDTRVSGTTSFKVDSKELLDSLVATVGQKSDLEPRGEAYVRKPKAASATP